MEGALKTQMQQQPWCWPCNVNTQPGSCGTSRVLTCACCGGGKTNALLMTHSEQAHHQRVGHRLAAQHHLRQWAHAAQHALALVALSLEPAHGFSLTWTRAARLTVPPAMAVMATALAAWAAAVAEGRPAPGGYQHQLNPWCLRLPPVQQQGGLSEREAGRTLKYPCAPAQQCDDRVTSASKKAHHSSTAAAHEWSDAAVANVCSAIEVLDTAASQCDSFALRSCTPVQSVKRTGRSAPVPGP